MRFWFLEYYEGFALPAEQRFERVRKWIDACVTNPAAQQVTKEEIVKPFYDYAKCAGNGALLPGRNQPILLTTNRKCGAPHLRFNAERIVMWS
jgi:glutathione S-transferase